jgi:hypothetical protein
MGGTVEEEMEGFKKVVEVVMDEVRKNDGQELINGSWTEDWTWPRLIRLSIVLLSPLDRSKMHLKIPWLSTPSPMSISERSETVAESSGLIVQCATRRFISSNGRYCTAIEAPRPHAFGSYRSTMLAGHGYGLSRNNGLASSLAPFSGQTNMPNSSTLNFS